MIQGIVLWYSERDQNGVILADNVEYYFDISTLVNRKDIPKRNQKVEFQPLMVGSVNCAKKVKGV